MLVKGKERNRRKKDTLKNKMMIVGKKEMVK